MFGIIALIVIQSAINVGLLLWIRRSDRQVNEILSIIDRVVSKIEEDREAINKLTYRP
jgi:TolB-like protein